MLQIPIAAIPNQTFSIQLDQLEYDIGLFVAEGIMAVDLVRADQVILTGQRVTPGSLVIPYKYLESGNFLISTLNDDYPDYTQFGLTQFLFYLSQSELEAIRAISP